MQQTAFDLLSKGFQAVSGALFWGSGFKSLINLICFLTISISGVMGFRLL